MTLFESVALRFFRISLLFVICSALYTSFMIIQSKVASSLIFNKNLTEYQTQIFYYRQVFDELKEKYNVALVNSRLEIFETPEPTEDGLTIVGQTDCLYRVAVSISIGSDHIKYSPPHEVIDTIKHELAHAFDCNIRGTSDHGPEWQKIAKRFGALPEPVYPAE